MELAWKATLAIVGAILLRRYVHPPGWGHPSLLNALLGIVCILPLARLGPLEMGMAGLGMAAALVPYRGRAERQHQRRLEGARSGLETLARSWGTSLRVHPETGLWEAIREDRGFWCGNVAIRLRSIHPGVRKSQTIWGMVFVQALPDPPPVRCSLVRGSRTPEYFEREWREQHVLQGDHLALTLGGDLFGSDLQDGAGGRRTRGDLKELHTVDLHDPRLGSFTVLTSDPGAFRRVFDADVLGALLEAAWTLTPYELNVTPASVTICTQLCSEDEQRRQIGLVDRLVQRLDSRQA